MSKLIKCVYPEELNLIPSIPNFKRVILAMLLAFASSACEKRNNTINLQEHSKISPTQGTNIYRYLSAISEAYPDKEALTQLCIRQHGFALSLPEQTIKVAHDIRLPAYEEWSEVQEVESQKYKNETVTVQPPSVNGIVMEKEAKEIQIPYSVIENIQTTKRISGTCIGTEYITQ